MTLPVSSSEPIIISERRGADDFAELVQVLAHQGPVTFVYASTSITHHHVTQAPVVAAATPGGWPGHPGTDVDLTGYGGAYVPPTDVAPLPAVPETRSYAPLAFLLCGWSTLAAALGCAVTGGNPAAVGATLAALTGSAASIAAIHRGRL
jgi:hypothetical protein